MTFSGFGRLLSVIMSLFAVVAYSLGDRDAAMYIIAWAIWVRLVAIDADDP